MIRLLMILATAVLLQPGSPPQPLGAVQREEIIKTMSSLLAERYLYEPEGKRRLAEKVDSDRAQGAAVLV